MAFESQNSGILVHGIGADSHTGCAHYRSAVDIVAIKFACCRSYYSCIYCHEAQAGHSTRIWNRSQFDQKAVLCGACGAELTIRQYLECGAVCPKCQSAFNPRCESHYHLYFETLG
jgi:uncharacterized CHY-type Zn-finger protein